MSRPNIDARLAQAVEHETLNLRVVGSSPTLGDVLGLIVKTSSSQNCVTMTIIPNSKHHIRIMRKQCET